MIDDKGVDGARAALVNDQHAASLVELDLRWHAGACAEWLNRTRDWLQTTFVVKSEASDRVGVGVHDVHEVVVVNGEAGWASATRRDRIADQTQPVVIDLEGRNGAAAGVHDDERSAVSGNDE